MTADAISTWVLVASRISTLSELQAVQTLSRNLATTLDPVNPQLAAQLRSNTYSDLISGLTTLRQNEALVKSLESGLTDETAAALVAQASELHRNIGLTAARHSPETQAASQSHTVLSYALSRVREVAGTSSALLAVGRIASEKIAESDSPLAFLGKAGQAILGATQERPSTSQYDYDIKRTQGRFFAHEESPLPATSEEGRTFFTQERRAELDAIAKFVSNQLTFNSPGAQEKYSEIRSKVVANHEPVRAKWDAAVTGMRNLGNIPNFKTVSDAYWRRDEAIRKNAGLKSRGFGPREYDLFRARGNFMSKEVAGKTAHRDRVSFYGGEFDYALEGICAEYAALARESQPNEAKLEKLAGERFRMEKAFMNLAADKPVSKEDSVFLDEIRGRYLPFVASNLDGLDLSGIQTLQAQAEAAYQQYSTQMHDRHLALAPMMLSHFVEEQRRILEIDRLEHEWQMARYKDLLARRRVTKSDLKRFEQALEDYDSTYQEYTAYAEKMLNGDPSKREYERNSKYRAVFVSLWNLHDTSKAILGENDLQILTFSFKTQAQFLARGDQGMVGLEPIAETTGRLGEVLKRNEDTIYSLPAIRDLAGRDWSMGQLAHYANNVHYIGAEKLVGFFSQEVRPETMLLEGAASLYPEGFSERQPNEFAHRSGVYRSLHLGQLEFSVSMGGPFQQGLGHVAILAQAGVGNFPVAGPFLYGMDRDGHHYLGSGALLDRSGGGEKRTHEAFTREVNLGMGNNVNVYESGTRDIGSPIASPYADLNQHPEAVHLPEYHGTRYNTGMSLRLGQEMGVPVIPVAYDLDQIYCEPSMPMPSNLADNFDSKDPRRIKNKLVKSYGGFWNDRTMLRYVRPGQNDLKVAYGDVMTPESMLGVDDLPTVLGAGYDRIAAIADEKKRAKAQRWEATLHNSATANFYERVAGYMATAGIYGPQARATVNGKSHLHYSLQPSVAMRH